MHILESLLENIVWAKEVLPCAILQFPLTEPLVVLASRILMCIHKWSRNRFCKHLKTNLFCENWMKLDPNSGYKSKGFWLRTQLQIWTACWGLTFVAIVCGFPSVSRSMHRIWSYHSHCHGHRIKAWAIFPPTAHTLPWSINTVPTPSCPACVHSSQNK